jgi:hypothetical protein
MTTRLSSGLSGSEGAALANIADQIHEQLCTLHSSGDSIIGAVADTFINSVYVLTGGSTCVLTTPTASQIVSAFTNAQVGSVFEVQIRNLNSGNCTVSGGSNVTMVNNSVMSGADTVVGGGTGQLYTGVVTAVDTPAVTLVGLLKTPS